MALRDTVNKMKTMFEDLATDLKKASDNGNKTAAQRVRTGTVRLEKLAKQYRKESILSEKKYATRKTKQKPTTSRKVSTRTSKKTTRRVAYTTKKTTTRRAPPSRLASSKMTRRKTAARR